MFLIKFCNIVYLYIKHSIIKSHKPHQSNINIFMLLSNNIQYCNNDYYSRLTHTYTN